MRAHWLMTTATTILLAACATGGTSATRVAEQQCGALVRGEGLRLVQIDAVESQGGNAQLVKLRVEDTLGRRFSTTCAVAADGAARWGQPLPANVSRG
jgi:hypothetical protein